MPIHSLTWPDRFFPFVLGQPNAKGKKQSGHVRLAYTAKLEMWSWFLGDIFGQEIQNLHDP